jgi:hypothetical protein
MKHLYLALIGLCLCFAVQGSHAQDRNFELGARYYF